MRAGPEEGHSPVRSRVVRVGGGGTGIAGGEASWRSVLSEKSRCYEIPLFLPAVGDAWRDRAG